MSERKIEVPLLKAYLRSVPGYPSYVPTWIVPAAWGIFVLVAILLFPVDLNGLSLLFSGGLALAFVHFMRANYKPRNDQERADEVMFSGIRKLKKVEKEGGFNRRLPNEVLYALEMAVSAYNSAVAKITIDDPVHAGERTRRIQQSLHACLFAAASVSRDEEHSKKEWNTILENKAHTAEIVDAIEKHTRRIRESETWDSERIAALRELDSQDIAHIRLND